MHSSRTILALGAIFAAVSAVPMKRDMVIDVVTEWDIVTEYATETVWVEGTSTWTATINQQEYTQPAPAPVATTSSLVAPAVAPALPTVPAPAPHTAAPSTTAPVIAPTSTTPVYVAPPAPTTAAYVAPVAPTTSVYVAPAPVTTEAPVVTPAAVPTTTSPVAEAPATTTAYSSSGSSSKTYTGQITYYDVGLGSCGQTNTDSEFVVAMAVGMMDKATMCGKTVTIMYQGSTHQATVVDTCMSCVPGDLDMSPALFKAVAPNGDGRVSGVSWYFNN